MEIDVFMSELYYEQVEQNVAYDLNNLWSKYIVDAITILTSILTHYRENFLEIDVFMSELYYEQVEQSVGYDTTNLWSE